MENIKNLKEAMEKIVNKYVKFYKTDLDIDLYCLYQYAECKSFIWITKKCGTELMIENNIKYRGTIENTKFMFWLNNPIIAAYRIVITDKSTMTGTIKKIDILKYYRNLTTKPVNGVNFAIITKDNNEAFKGCVYADSVDEIDKKINEIISKMHLDFEDILAIRRLSYL